MNSVLQQGSHLNQGSRLTLILKRGSWGSRGIDPGLLQGSPSGGAARGSRPVSPQRSPGGAGRGRQEYDLVSQQETPGGGAAQHVIPARGGAGRLGGAVRGGAGMSQR
jgi:hypothetical protein